MILRRPKQNVDCSLRAREFDSDADASSVLSAQAY